jgi:hypothetical protein
VFDADYRSSLKDWNSFVESLTEELTKIDDTVPELPLKDVVSIIYGLAIRIKLTYNSSYRSSASTETYDSAKILHPTRYVPFGRNTHLQAASKWPLFVYCGANTNALTSYSHISPPHG